MPKKKRAGRRTRRTVPAVSIRKWVIAQDSEAIAVELAARIKAVDQLVTPYYDGLERIYRLEDEFAQKQGRRRGAPWTRRHIIWHARTIAFLGIAATWGERAYKSGQYLPRIEFPAYSGPMPWDPLPPDAIHLLDLRIEDLKTGFQKGGVKRAFEQIRRFRPPDGPPVGPGEVTPTWVYAPLMIAVIRSQGPRAFRNVAVMSLLEQLRYEADYSDTKKARQEAAFWVDRLQRALSPDTRKHVERSPGKLRRDLEVYRGVYAELSSLRNAVGTESELLRQARRIDPALRMQDLDRFKSESFLHEVALRVTSRRRKLALDTVKRRDQWFRQMTAVKESWEDFREWYETEEEDSELKNLFMPPPAEASGFLPTE